MSMLSIMERFKLPPSVILDEDSGLMRLLEIEKLVLDANPDYYKRE